MHLSRVSVLALAAALTCGVSAQPGQAAAPAASHALTPVRPEIYAPVTLTADLAPLTAKEREMVSLFIDASVIMDDLFWRQAYPGDRAKLLAGITDRPPAVSSRSITDRGIALPAMRHSYRASARSPMSRASTRST